MRYDEARALIQSGDLLTWRGEGFVRRLIRHGRGASWSHVGIAWRFRSRLFVLEACDWLRERILGQPVIIKTHKDKQGKYGRWLAEVYPADEPTKSFNVLLVEDRLAVEAFC